jgi:hypothetical protein
MSKEHNLVITINLDNDAFTEYECIETARVLHNIVNKLDEMRFVASLDDEILRDINGNICGNIKFKTTGVK